MRQGTLLIRADASVSAGTGHVMRCLALAQAWRYSGGAVIFAMAKATNAIQERLRSEPVRVIPIHAEPGSAGDLQRTIDAARNHKAEWLVMDGYHFSAHYVSELQNVLPVLFMDDNGELESYSSALVLNQNAHARTEMYVKRAPHTRLLLGPRYALLRNEFTTYCNWMRETTERGFRVLITMGGSDPQNLTPRVLSVLAGISIADLLIRVVVGGSAENQSAIAKSAEKFPGRVEVMSNVANMAELMAWADLAVAGAGTTCWEMCLLGLPAILIVAAENQRFIAARLEEIGAAINAGPAESVNDASLAQMAAELLGNRKRRFQMSQSARQLVDGKGRERVLEMMQTRHTSCA